jgi:hypothetical protein
MKANKPLEWTGHQQLSAGATSASLPATQGRRSKNVPCLREVSKAALRGRSQGATVGGWLKSARQSGSSDGLRVSVI